MFTIFVQNITKPVTLPLTWAGRIKASLLIAVVNLTISYFFYAIGLNELNPKSSDQFSQWLLQANIFILIIGLFTLLPLETVIEEFVFRYLPYKLIASKNGRYFWHIGIISSLLFAWIHGFPGLQEFRGLPIPQLFTGLYLWRFISTGFKEVFWIHYLSDSLLLIIGVALYKLSA